MTLQPKVIFIETTEIKSTVCLYEVHLQYHCIVNFESYFRTLVLKTNWNASRAVQLAESFFMRYTAGFLSVSQIFLYSIIASDLYR